MLYHRALENYEFENRRKNNNSSTFRPIMIFQLIVQKSGSFKWKNLLQIKAIKNS